MSTIGSSCSECFTQPALWEFNCPICHEFFCSKECQIRHLKAKSKPGSLAMLFGLGTKKNEPSK